jgi:two-component system cell cycle response regulator
MRILIAEDEPVSRLLLERFLQQWGYEVVSASDGDEAWWILQREDAPRLAILDWMMPGMDGPQICREVRRRVGQPYTYLILLTAKAQKEDLVEGLEAGADDYLTKPFDANELRVRLRAGRRILDLQEYLISSSEAQRYPATHDFLTGLWNREAILGILRQLTRERRNGAPVGVILASLDHFKHLNNTHGPRAGDAILREAARRLRANVRIYDSIGRYSGGEFLVVAPGCKPGDLVALAESLRQALAAENIDVIGGAVPVTISLGVAITAEENGLDADGLLRAAAGAVHKAKMGGRNRVESAIAPEITDIDLSLASSASEATQ